MQFLTDFADQRLMLPLILVVAVALALSGWKRGAAAWVAVGIGTLACLAVLKIVLLACGWRWTNGDLNSPSGHTASAALFYGGLALLFIRPRGPARYLVLLIPVLLALVVGVSRIALHNHTLDEVLAGGLIGTAAALLLPLLAGRPPPNLPVRTVLISGAAVLLLFHGSHLQIEGMLRRFTIEDLWPPEACRIPQDEALGPVWLSPRPAGISQHVS